VEQIQHPPHRPNRLSRDGYLLFAARFIRMFAYGALSVILVLYLAEIGLEETNIGFLLTLTLAGDTVISLILTTRADRWGRRNTLLAGAALMFLAGVVFASTVQYPVLLLAATIGVISPSGTEVGPFLPVEQAALSQVLAPPQRTRVFSWYALAGSVATALGSLSGGVVSTVLQDGRHEPLAGYRGVILGYAVLGLVLGGVATRLSDAIEVRPVPRAAPGRGPARFGLQRSGGVVGRLAALFALDSFAGGFVLQSLAAYWFHLRFGVEPAALGGIFFAANLLAGLSALVAARLASRFGLINTMVFTHLPSNILLILVPLMPGRSLAIGLLLIRFSISQMDVPTRQSYLMAVVDPGERSAAAGLAGVARTTGAAVSPLFSGILLGHPLLLNAPFYLAGSLKIVYDLLLYRGFLGLRPPEEAGSQGSGGS